MKVSFFAVIFAVLIGTIFTAAYIHNTMTQRSRQSFTVDTDHINNQLLADLESYNDILYSGRSFITSSNEVTQSEWVNFFKTQDILSRHPGISSIAYVAVVPAAQKQTFENKLRQDPYFGPNFTIKPTNSTGADYGAGSLVYTDNDVSSTLGTDAFRTPDRKATYDIAAQKNAPTASPPIVFASGPLGFFVALPVFSAPGSVQGFVTVSFRANDFVKAISEHNYARIALNVTDITDPNAPVELYNSPKLDKNSQKLTRTNEINVAGRTWRVSYYAHEPYDFPRLSNFVTRVVFLVGALVILSLVLIHHLFKHRPPPKTKQS